jgi:predicted alpha-1,6-mannanase (GH76 family)
MAAVLLAVLGAGAGGAEEMDAKEAARRADEAVGTLVAHFWDAKEGNFYDHYPSPRGHTGYWTSAQAIDAVLDAAERTKDPRYLEVIRGFFKGRERRGWLVDFYDDENWMALALLRAHKLTGDEAYLRQSETLMADISKEWDTSCCGEEPGGIWWDQAHTQKATASNAGPALLAARLYQETQKQAYLDFSRQVYAYWRKNMVDPKTYQVLDHIEPSGAKLAWRFTYNEGLMIGAAAELYRTTHEKAYLEDAHHIAAFMVAKETHETRLGPVLHDGSNEQCRGDGQAFKGVGCRYLALLQQVSPRKEYLTVLRAGAEAVWELGRDPQTGILAVSWAGPPMKSASTAQQAAATMAVSMYADLLSRQEPKRPPERTGATRKGKQSCG